MKHSSWFERAWLDLFEALEDATPQRVAHCANAGDGCSAHPRHRASTSRLVEVMVEHVREWECESDLLDKDDALVARLFLEAFKVALDELQQACRLGRNEWRVGQMSIHLQLPCSFFEKLAQTWQDTAELRCLCTTHRSIRVRQGQLREGMRQAFQLVDERFTEVEGEAGDTTLDQHMRSVLNELVPVLHLNR